MSIVFADLVGFTALSRQLSARTLVSLLNQVFSRFDELARDKMAVLISHRFSTVRKSDRIVVLEDGRIHEQGTHDQLVATGGRYARLFELQAASYR